ncbi:hypothetical protein A1F99_019900 [Pyrenophora tritici-repentis]|nr:hypothetical protein A1F99_019900 [Pyrenophora tritici-repentis]
MMHVPVRSVKCVAKVATTYTLLLISSHIKSQDTGRQLFVIHQILTILDPSSLSDEQEVRRNPKPGAGDDFWVCRVGGFAVEELE